jgi:RNA polymerase sigma-70 factor (ECF subfamily)
VNDDAQLISQALAGQTAAFGQLVEKYQDRLYNTLVHVAGNAEDAKDVVQEAFVQAFLKLESFQGASAFYTWLYRIAFNVAATHRRRRGAMRTAEQTAIADGQLRGSEGASQAAEGPSDRLERDERCRQVRHAISQLPEEYRVVLVLREMEGYCYESIAEVLDLPVGTVRSRLHRARLQLREQLKEVLAVEE